MVARQQPSRKQIRVMELNTHHAPHDHDHMHTHIQYAVTKYVYMHHSHRYYTQFTIWKKNFLFVEKVVLCAQCIRNGQLYADDSDE